MSAASSSIKVECVLFDVDNTLVDTTPLIRAALTECGCPRVEEIADGEITAYSPPRILGARGCGHLAAQYWRAYEKLAAKEARLFDPKTPEVLDSLLARHVGLGVVTSCKKSATEAILGACGLAEFFCRCLVTYGSCRPHKPHPAPILFALEMVGRPAAATIYVGDAQKDQEASRGAGVRFALAGWARSTHAERTALTPDIALKRIGDLLNHT